MKKVPLQPVSGLTESRKARSLYRWLSRVTGVDACWLEGTGQDGSPAWAVIKRIAGTALYLLRSSLWRKTALASIVAAPLLFSPAKLKAQHTAIIEDYMVGSPHGFQVSGASDGDNLGERNTITSGDINGDGIEDLILGARDAGEAYVIFGSTGTFSSSFELTDLDGSNGFVISAVSVGDHTGSSVASGDIDGDGVDDVIVGAPGAYYRYSADIYDGGYSGAVYVVFGSSTAFADTVQLSSLGSDGFVVKGDIFDEIGYSLATGDVNGDGFDDLVTGGAESSAHYYYEAYYGSGYIYSNAFVVFGDSALADTVRAGDLDGDNGFKLFEYNYYGIRSSFGKHVTTGDLDGDGYDEVIIGSYYNYDYGDAGSTYVIFGQSNSFDSEIDVFTMAGSIGFALEGINDDDNSGSALATGDVDGDGTDDLLIGARNADPNGSNSGETYVVFGDTDGFTSDIELSSLDGNTGFTLNGIEEDDHSGTSIAVEDINADGINDIIIGADRADRTNPTTNSSGDVYVVFGPSSGFGSVFELSSLEKSTGFTLQGQTGFDRIGSEVLVADFDGDNKRDELVIGAFGAEPDGSSDNGIVYVFTQPVLEQEVTGGAGFRTLGAPASGTLFDNLLEDFWTQGILSSDSSDAAFDDNVWTWDTDTQAWTPLTNLNTNSLDEAQGFLFYIFSDDNGPAAGNTGFPKTLSTFNLVPDGSETLGFNSGTASPVSNLDPGDFFFAGNPYLYPLDWDALFKDGMTNTVYVYDDASSDWQSWNGTTGGLTDGIIAPFQGFFTQANLAGSGGSLVIEEGDTVSTSASLLKMALSTPRVLKLTAEAGELTTNAWLSFQQGGEVGRDDFDALALQSLAATWLRLATVISTQDVLQINALPPDQGEELRFPLELSGTVDAQTATLSLEGLEAFEGWTLELHDLETGEVYPLLADTKLSVPIEQIQARQASALQPGSPVAVHAKTNGHRFQLVLIPAITVHNEPVSDVPTMVELQQNYPNPFNPSTTIEYGVPEAGAVTLEVFDVMGRKVATLVERETMQPGRYLIRFDASQLASGMYLYRLQTGAVTLTRKLTLIK